MRIRATVAAVTGALALSALAVPAAQADGSAADEYRASVAQVRQAAAGDARTARGGEPYPMDVTFSNYRIGKTIKVGVSGTYSATVSYKLTHAADIDVTADDFVTGPFLYRGDAVLFAGAPATCTDTSATTATCTGRIEVLPAEGDLLNSDAGTWKGAALAIDHNGQNPTAPGYDNTESGYAEQGGLATTLVQRASKLTVNASPEPVKEGATITVAGKLTRANWETGKYVGLPGGQAVKLQFRKASSSAYSDVKTIKTASGGALKTYVKAGVDGYYRFAYASITSTAGSVAAGDYVDVK